MSIAMITNIMRAPAIGNKTNGASLPGSFLTISTDAETAAVSGFEFTPAFIPSLNSAPKSTIPERYINQIKKLTNFHCRNQGLSSDLKYHVIMYKG